MQDTWRAIGFKTSIVEEKNRENSRKITSFRQIWPNVSVATVLEIREKSGNSGKNKKVREKSGNFDRLSGPKSSSIPQVQLDDLSFFQNVTSRSQGKFSEARRSQGKRRSKKGGHPESQPYNRQMQESPLLDC